MRSRITQWAVDPHRFGAQRDQHDHLLSQSNFLPAGLGREPKLTASGNHRFPTSDSLLGRCCKTCTTIGDRTIRSCRIWCVRSSMMQPLGGGCWIGKQLAQRSTMTSSRPVTTAGRVVVLGLRRSNGITLSDGAARGNRAQSRRYGRLSSAGYLRSWALITRRSVQLRSTACCGGRTGLPAGGCATAGTFTRIEQAPLRPSRVIAELHGVPRPG